jgi:hypothetical protein
MGVEIDSRFAWPLVSLEFAMSTEATRRAPMISLAELVQIYRSEASDFGQAVPLSAFRLAPEETERVFSNYEEDYHIGRFFHFSEGSGTSYSINGVAVTHVSLDSEIASIL